MTYIKSSSFYTTCPKKSSVPTPASVAVGWHPGIYIYPSYNNTNNVIPSGQWATIKSELQAFNAFRGVQLRINWDQIEVAKDDYSGVVGLKDYLDEIAQLSNGATRKYGFALFHVRHAHTNDALSAMDMVPAYMRPYDAATNPTGDPGGGVYGGGQWYFESENPKVPGAGGKLICWWNANVRARASLLAEALGDELNAYVSLELGNAASYRALEGISISETATGAPHTTLSQPPGVSIPFNWQAKYAEGYHQFSIALRNAFPNTIVGAFVNHARDQIETMIEGGRFDHGGAIYTGLSTLGCALGNPNTASDEKPLRADFNDGNLGGWKDERASIAPGPAGAFNPGIYFYYNKYAGELPITLSWQPPDYMCTALGGSVASGAAVCPAGSHHPTIDEMYQFTKNNLHGTHLFATRTTNLTYWADFKAYLTSTGLKNSVTGGLNSAPPSCYSSVDTD